jgi:energy-coupling factor transport system ATP-binding protein
MAAAVTLNAFSYCYPSATRNALTDISLHLPAGSCCALLGPTNAGKSTLLQALAGTLGKHYAGKATGSITIGTERYHPLPSTVLFPHVGMVLQDPHVQISGLHESVYDEIAFTLRNIGTPFDQERKRIHEVSSTLGLEPLLSRDPSTLSGGELQRVALASILVAEPDVLLLDEPVVSLDAANRTALTRFLRSINKRTTIVWAETQIDEVLFAADTFVVLNEGRSVFLGGRRAFCKQLGEFDHLLPVNDWISLSHRLDSGTNRNNPLHRRLQHLLPS